MTAKDLYRKKTSVIDVFELDLMEQYIDERILFLDEIDMRGADLAVGVNFSDLYSDYILFATGKHLQKMKEYSDNLGNKELLDQGSQNVEELIREKKIEIPGLLTKNRFSNILMLVVKKTKRRNLQKIKGKKFKIVGIALRPCPPQQSHKLAVQVVEFSISPHLLSNNQPSQRSSPKKGLNNL